MKNILFAVCISLNTFSIQAQENKKIENEFFQLWVYYSVRDNKIIPNLYVDIGTSKYHSLKGTTSNGAANTVIFNDSNGVQQVFSNEVDFLKFIIDQGWVIYNKEQIELLGRNYIKYTFEKEY